MRAPRDVLDGKGGSRNGRPRLSREQTLARVIACIEFSERPRLELEDFYAAAGVSPRTLRTMFMDVFGMTPSRYLRLRRLHQLRTALLMADPLLRTVNDICVHVRLNDAGRVAGEYCALFGEYPSQTLARSPSNGRVAATQRQTDIPNPGATK